MARKDMRAMDGRRDEGTATVRSATGIFCVRLLELAGKGTEEDRFSFLVGAFVAADLDALVARKILVENIPVVITGNEALAEAWREALQERSVPAKVLTTDEAEKAFVCRSQINSASSWRKKQEGQVLINVGTEER